MREAELCDYATNDDPIARFQNRKASCIILLHNGLSADVNVFFSTDNIITPISIPSEAILSLHSFFFSLPVPSLKKKKTVIFVVNR